MENNVSFKVVGYFNPLYRIGAKPTQLEEHYSDYNEAVERATDLKGNPAFDTAYVIGNQTGEILWGA